MTRSYRTSGNDRSWQFRPSDHARDSAWRRHVHGPIEPMPRAGLLARLFGRA